MGAKNVRILDVGADLCRCSHFMSCYQTVCIYDLGSAVGVLLKILHAKANRM